MEAFVKIIVADTKDPWRSRTEIAEDYWRDALEWVLNKCHHYQNQDVIDAILKELGDR